MTNSLTVYYCDAVGTSELAEEFPSIEKFNWLINLLHVRGDTPACKELIKKEIKRSNGKNEFAYFKQVCIGYI